MVTPTSEPLHQQPIINDFSIHIATTNGSGSQTANGVILRALFKMGIPVSGKNMFPSNIKGLPTWYTIRLSKAGYVARRDNIEILIAMNQKSVIEDHQQLATGGVCIYDDRLRFERREDVTYYALPVKQLLSEEKIPRELKNYLVNMIYVGALAQLIGIDLSQIEAAIQHHFKGKPKPVALNMGMVNRAFQWTSETINKADLYYAEPMNATEGRLMIDGNSAAGLGTVYGGVSVVAWYPITPSTSIIDAVKSYLPRLRQDPESGQATYAVIQAEDELAAIGMLMGAGWAGGRALTATSGAGIALMAEFAGLGYFAEIPAVIWDVMRMGPSTGLPTRTSQGDVLFTYTLGHGDTKQVCLFPASMAECFEFGWAAFDFAEQLQTPVFVLSDIDLGMNQWMTPPFEYPDKPMNRGKVLNAEQLSAIQDYGRYRDVDGDGIAYRTLPETNHPSAAFVTRGVGHNPYAAYSERPDDWQNNLKRLHKKFETAKTVLPAPIVERHDGATVGLIAYGSSDPAVVEARDQLTDQGLPTSYLRLRALPMSDMVEQFIDQHEQVYVIEHNFNGQLHQILNMELSHVATKLQSVAHCDGLPLTVAWLTQRILQSFR
ncbi:2-oxoacid:acceptor oxidoreductase subunit alpha [Anaerolineales bacterium HSG6]|nr:2-oxoacid:acceptor oxidoreductase subunit alpha [Anaerolineales bacterium HSG6]